MLLPALEIVLPGRERVLMNCQHALAQWEIIALALEMVLALRQNVLTALEMHLQSQRKLLQPGQNHLQPLRKMLTALQNQHLEQGNRIWNLITRRSEFAATVSRGAVEPWSRGAVEPWSRGAVEPWSRGAWKRGATSTAFLAATSKTYKNVF